MNPRKQLRALLARQAYTIVPGSYDVLTARLIQLAGFEAVYLTGGGYSRSNGYPDIGLLTMTEVTQWIARVVEAVQHPGDRRHGRRLRQRAQRHARGARVRKDRHRGRSTSKTRCRPRSAATTRASRSSARPRWSARSRPRWTRASDADMVIIARSDARAIEGLQASIDRVNAYLEAGADVGFVEAPQSAEELAAIPGQLIKPALANIFEGGKTPPLPKKDLEKMGFRIGIYPSQTHRAAIAAAKKVLAVLKRDGDTAAIEGELATFQDREEAVDSKRWQALETKYLKNV